LEPSNEKYTNVKDLGKRLKSVLGDHGSSICPFGGDGASTDHAVSQYIGGLLDLPENRKSFIKNNEVSKTIRNLLTEKEYTLLISLLKSYKEELYGKFSDVK
jgi:hypothetical protein